MVYKLPKICICGIGYVGLTLAVIMAEKGFEVTGVEIRPEIVESLQKGIPHFHEIGLEMLLQLYVNKNLKFATTIPDEKFDVFVITVGTPLKTGFKEPDLQYIINVAEGISHHLNKNALVVLRSTVVIGTTRQVVLPILAKNNPIVNIAFCPERTIEGKALEELKVLPQIVGGINQESVEKSVTLFRKITPTVIEVSSLETAEMVKLLDNAYRDLNFAFANEVAGLCEHIGIDGLEVVRAGRLGYPRTHIPDPGYVGGACLEKDPHILTYSAGQYFYSPYLVKHARQIHEALPGIVVRRIQELLLAYGKDPANAKIFISGMAFKGQPETDDLRGSPSLMLLDEFKKIGAHQIFAHDFIVMADTIAHLGVKPVSIEAGFNGADVALIANNHAKYKGLNIFSLLAQMNQPAIFYDSWRLFDKAAFTKIEGIHYEGLGYRQNLTGRENHHG